MKNHNFIELNVHYIKYIYNLQRFEDSVLLITKKINTFTNFLLTCNFRPIKIEPSFFRLNLYINTCTICKGIETSHGAVRIKQNQSWFGGAVSTQDKTIQVIVPMKISVYPYFKNTNFVIWLLLG